MQFFNDRTALETHLLGIEAALTQPIKRAPARIRDLIIAKAAVFLADCIGKRSLELHNELSRRIAFLEQRPTSSFLTVWEEGRIYGPGAFAIHGGKLWRSARDTRLVPGQGEDWALLLG